MGFEGYKYTGSDFFDLNYLKGIMSPMIFARDYIFPRTVPGTVTRSGFIRQFWQRNDLVCLESKSRGRREDCWSSEAHEEL